jgi:murein DD-endopeptidase MepM/ murein hydrolase activator NlpD
MRFPRLQMSVAWLILLSICSPAAADSILSAVPGPFPDGMDTWFPKNGNAVHDTTLRVGVLAGIEDDTLVRFNLGGLPQVATHAYLTLHPVAYAGTSPTTMNVYRITSQWHSGTVGWSTQPSSILLSPPSPAPAPQPPGVYRLDITAMYNQWRSAASLNYGLRLTGSSTTNNRFSMFSSSSAPSNRPQLDVSYTPQASDSIFKLKWPLGTPYASRGVPTQPFGVNWAGANKATGAGYCNGLIEKHNGTDFHATPGTAVYAAEDGVIREVLLPSQTEGWAYNIVLEHTHATIGKYTTVYWHVNPVSDVLANSSGGFVPKGMQIATVADLSIYPYNPPHVSHFHFGLRIGAYDSRASGTGALPQTACGNRPAFAAGFIDPNTVLSVIFQ